ncbi:MAG: UDP-N-acetylglucosamine 1-carboxyvinyltransferase [Oscillospiraceae bacterium]|nr:UDP-N-acetylglucosamine 1-carboxyvinyltransferase [Oscillospiraceae bacterium]
MSFFEITGGRHLSGSIAAHGAKNSVLPILAASILARGQSVIENCPRLSDVDATVDILRQLGCRVERQDDVLTVDAACVQGGTVPGELMGRMRSSVIFLGAILARTGQAQMTHPGGCELGPRPIDLHLQALRALGVRVQEEDGVLSCSVPDGLRAGQVRLPFPSVGATENAMIAACGARGISVITGAAREPEIEDLQRFLNAMGARVRGAGTSVITVQGSDRLHGANHRVMGDRIVAATYLAAAAAAGGQVEVTGVQPEHLTGVLDVLARAGCRIRVAPSAVCLTGTGRLGGVSGVITTAPYPGFPTDAQAPVMAALACGEGVSRFQENIFQSRYRHVSELARMGADIRLTGRMAEVWGTNLHGACVDSTDLRGGAALVVAALAARGVSRVGEIHHIDRGYERLEESFARLGGQIERRDDRRSANGCKKEQAQTVQKKRTLRLPL